MSCQKWLMDVTGHYHLLLGLGLDWKIDSVDLDASARRVDVKVSWCGLQLRCPDCGVAGRHYDFREERSWRHLDTMQFETRIHCRVPRVECPEHGVKTVSTPWADRHSRFTVVFEAFAVQVLLACATVKAACGLLGLNWEQVRGIQERAVERGLARRAEEEVPYVGLDEKSFGKGHDYITVMSDLEGGRVLEVAEERKQEAADGLLETLSEGQRQGVMAVAVDMWPAFMNAVAKVLPDAAVVHDKFHVAKHLGEAVDPVRRAENKALCRDGDDRLKGAKYLFLKREENLTDKQRERFDTLRNSGLKSARAWALKETFADFWTYEWLEDSRDFFKYWYAWAIRSRLQPIKKKAKMLKKHLAGLLNHTLHPITNAVTEGLNSKIQLIKASARGFRSFKNYRIAILFYCGKLNLLPQNTAFPQNS